MKIEYTPGPQEPTTVSTLGLHFRKGEAIDVTDRQIIEKLKGNPHFSVDGGRQRKPTIAQANAAGVEGPSTSDPDVMQRAQDQSENITSIKRANDAGRDGRITTGDDD